MLGQGDVDPALQLKKSLRFSDKTGDVLQQTTVGVNLCQIFPGMGIRDLFSFLFSRKKHYFYLQINVISLNFSSKQ